MQVVLFEDAQVQELSPLTDLVSMQELVVGGAKQYLRFEVLYGLSVKWAVRGLLKERVPRERVPELGSPALLLNSRVMQVEALSEAMKLDYGESLVCGSGLLAAKIRELSEDQLEAATRGLAIGRAKPCDFKLIKSLWELVPLSLVELMTKDLAEIYRGSEISVGGLTVVGKHTVVVKDGVEALGPVTIDVREGPVVIERGVVLEPYSHLKGPLYIGEGAQVMSGSRIAGSYLGTQARVGGEVSTSVISDFSNKIHFGFVGHSYFGRWVNVGAGSVTSNLKNTYGEVKVRGQSTGLSKVGAYVGDHAKLSIGTLTYAGTIIGTASHVHGLIAEEVTPFTIYGKSLGWDPVEIELDSVIRTYRRMAPRRNVEPDPIEEKLLEELFKATEGARRRAGVRKGKFERK
ncbi:MAG: putative sugar nucleotidyl transferase [Candidatus Korarchaeum sp.]|nr:putative sugar nucleotidyl transferase [Candidatus Korarchaeum sp.]MDW8035398.1 putative sugar nucleotidyl transferase [Candidatus Korarchaeum sp.]